MKNIKVKTAVSKGIVMGKVFVVDKLDLSASKNPTQSKDDELQRLQTALDKAKKEIETLAEHSEIFAAHLEVADDPSLYDGIVQKINNEQKNAELALEETTQEICLMFESLDDEYLKERAMDIRDVSKRLMGHLKGVAIDIFANINEEVIVFAQDLTPSDTANMNFKYIKGFVTASGGVTSHVAIMARQLSIPAMVGVNGILEEVQKENYIILDCIDNEIIIDPNEDVIETFKNKAQDFVKEKQKFEQAKNAPAITKDARRVDVFSNVGNILDVENAVENGSEGIGLFRTEFLYMESKQFPTQDEQFEVYKEAVEKNNGTMIVRTLDIGGDKSLSYYKFETEENPFLGWRAIRICLDLQDIFKTQLKALLRASAFGDIKIMYPMIISLEELRLANSILEECKMELEEKGIDFNKNIETGVMIETPSAVFVAEDLAKEADFFSIGTNDLTQYILAVDRGNQKISNLYNSFHPAVLRAVKTIIEAAHKHGKMVGMCGEFASDEKAIQLLLGLGLDEFSVVSSAIAQVKYAICDMDYSKAKILAKEVCEKSTIEEVLSLLN